MARRGLLFGVLLVVLLLVVVFVANFFVQNLHGANLVRNGSFELGPFVVTPGEGITQGYKLLCGGSSSLQDWQVSKQGATSQDCTSANDAVVWAMTPNGNPGDPDTN